MHVCMLAALPMVTIAVAPSLQLLVSMYVYIIVPVTCTKSSGSVVQHVTVMYM